ncbi:MAG: hypothetical protein K2X35_07580 [Bryobacteraceae bacterium]|nr:hypothetical protein [Bryobacteraceae bacterium]
MPRLLPAMLCLLAAGVSAVGLRPPHLFSEDCINFAMALERFDPRNLIPQPPGYPLFVLQSQMIQRLLGLEAGAAFTIGVILGAALSLWLAFLLACRMFQSVASGWIAALLLAVNPSFLFEISTSTIRVWIAAVNLLVAYACWRAWTGESRWAWIAAAALGIGSGYRPELLALLMPLAVVSIARGAKHSGAILGALALGALCAAAWLAFLASRFESTEALFLVFRDYLRDQSRDASPVYGGGGDAYLRMLVKMLVWNGFAIGGWIGFRYFARPAFPIAFFALWAVPTLVFQGLVHAGSPGHGLGVIAASCILGGATLAAMRHRFPALVPAALAFVVTLNVLWFWSPRLLYLAAPRVGIGGELVHLRKQLFDAAWETAWPLIHDVDVDTRAVIRTTEHLTREHPSAPIFWNRSPVNWRKISYYLPNQPITLLLDTLDIGNRPHASVWRRVRLVRVLRGDPVDVPAGRSPQVIWVIGRDSPVYRSLYDKLTPMSASGVYLADVRWGTGLIGYRLVP